MIITEQIPDEVVEASTRAIGEAISLWLHEHPGCGLEDVETHKLAREAIVAAINAWPEAGLSQFHENAFVLPLPQEGDV